MKRVLALVGAALLIGLAVVVRGVLVDDGSDRDDVSTNGGSSGSGDDLVVACITELEAVCEMLDVADLRVEDPDDTIAAADDIDAWVTLDPWPEIAGFENAPATLTGPLSVVAGTPVLLLGRDGKLPAGCVDWLCAASADAALSSPNTALGLISLGIAGLNWSVASGLERFTRDEVRGAEFRQWLDGIDLTADPVLDMLQLGAAGPGATNITFDRYADDVIGSREEPNLAEAARPGSVVAVVTGPGAEQIREPLAGALRAAGWEPAEPGARSTGVPSAGVLVALAEEVS